MTQTHKFGPIAVRPDRSGGRLSGKWVVDIPPTLTSTGKRIRRFYPSRTRAFAIARELNRQLAMRRHGIGATNERPTIALVDAVRDWLDVQERRVRTRKLEAASLVTRRHQLKAILAHFRGYSVGSIATDHLEAYQEQRFVKGIAARTVNDEVAVLRQILRWLAKRGDLNSVPTVDPMPVDAPGYDVPTLEEVARIIGHLPSRLRPLVRLMAETGMRPGEAFNLPWEHVDEVNGHVYVRPFDGWKPKTRSSVRRIPLTEGMLTELRRLPKDSVYVFPGKRGGPVTSIRKALAKAVCRAGVSRYGKPLRISAKTFRKAYATWQAERRVPPRVLQGLMGHVPGSRMTDRYYVTATDAMLRDAMFELPPGTKGVQCDTPLAESGSGA